MSNLKLIATEGFLALMSRFNAYVAHIKNRTRNSCQKKKNFGGSKKGIFDEITEKFDYVCT